MSATATEAPASGGELGICLPIAFAQDTSVVDTHFASTIDANAKPGAAHIVVTTAHPWPVVLGRILTLLGLLGLLGLAGVGAALLARGRRGLLS
jgi:hypothetical protein